MSSEALVIRPVITFLLLRRHRLLHLGPQRLLHPRPKWRALAIYLSPQWLRRLLQQSRRRQLLLCLQLYLGGFPDGLISYIEISVQCPAYEER